jgi:hypothetical protein
LRLGLTPSREDLEDKRLHILCLLASFTGVNDGHSEWHFSNSLESFSLEGVKFFKLLEIGVLESEVAERRGIVVRHLLKKFDKYEIIIVRKV